MARGVTFGSVVGAALGCMIVLPDLVWRLTDIDSTGHRMVTMAWLPLAAAIGAAVGAMSALIASAGWLVSIQSTPHRPRRAQVIASVCAAATVLAISILVLGTTWLGAAATMVAATISFLVAPRLGFRRNSGRRT